jgi:hypothetical protein
MPKQSVIFALICWRMSFPYFQLVGGYCDFKASSSEFGQKNVVKFWVICKTASVLFYQSSSHAYGSAKRDS